MALAAVLDSIDALPDAVKSEYKKDERSGKFLLDVTPAKIGDATYEFVNTHGLKSALEKERTEKATLKDAVKAFEGLDAKAAREALTKVEEMKTWTPEDKVKATIEATKNDLVKQHKLDSDAKDAKITKLSGALRKNLVIAAATKAISEEKGSVALLLPHVESKVRLREDNDQFIVEVLGDEGNVRVDGSGNPLGIPQFVKELKDHSDYARAFESSGATGTGATGGNTNQQTQVQRKGEPIRIPASNQAMKNKYIKEIGTGAAIVVSD